MQLSWQCRDSNQAVYFSFLLAIIPLIFVLYNAQPFFQKFVTVVICPIYYGQLLTVTSLGFSKNSIMYHSASRHLSEIVWKDRQWLLYYQDREQHREQLDKNSSRYFYQGMMQSSSFNLGFCVYLVLKMNDNCKIKLILFPDHLINAYPATKHQAWRSFLCCYYLSLRKVNSL